jgi:DNA-binding NarL/FixJ family response regulator
MAEATRLFSPREAQIMALIERGLSDKQIALSLGVSYRTIRTHLERLFKDHGLHNRASALARWLHEGKP